MSALELVLATGVALCAAAVLYAYLGYPVMVWSLSRWFGNRRSAPAVPNERLPSVSLLIVAHNEEAEIEKRIVNALALDYPREKLEVVVASDGSTDRTNEIVCRYLDRGVRLLAYPERRGKAAVLNSAFAELRNEIVILSDANTYTAAESARSLASWFADPEVGVVCGRLILTDPRTGGNVDSLYWKYETFLKKCESRLGALLGSNGGIYAIRKSLFQGIPNDTIVDDFVIPLLARKRTGCQIVYDKNASATEETPETIAAEFRRRSRIGAGGFQSIGRLRGLLHPRHGWVAFTFWSHKVLRWLCPFFLIGAFAANAALAAFGNPLFVGMLLAQVGFYTTAVLANWLPARPRCLRVFRLATMFTMMNAALLVGFFRWLFGTQKGVWKRTERSPGAPVTGLPEVVG